MLFDFISTPEAIQEFIHPQITNSSLSVELKFDVDLARNMQLFFLGEISSTIYIDSTRNVSKNFFPNERLLMGEDQTLTAKKFFSERLKVMRQTPVNLI